MPSLVAFGRRWSISSDDFVFPELTEAFFRVVWVCVAFGLYTIHSPLHCSNWEGLPYIGVMVVINLLAAALAVLTAIVSARGSILDVYARRHVVTLLYLRVPLCLVEFAWTVISTLIIFDLFDVKDWCPGFFVHALRVCVLLEWCLIIALTFSTFVAFNPQGGHSTDNALALERRYWRSKLRWCKFRQPDHVREAVDEIAHLVATLFARNDFVFSDIVAGLLLLVHSPNQPPPELEAISEEECAKIPEWMRAPECLPTLLRMLDFSVAIYGWPSYMLNNCGCMPWIRLGRKLFGCCRRNPLHPLTIIDDNCCSCHTGAFVLESDFNETDLVFASYRNDLFQVPFIVLIDHQSRCIVVAIRGSASLLDLVTDLSLDEDIFSVDVDTDPVLVRDKELDGHGQVRVHRGMLRAARCVYETLREYGVVEEQRALHPSYELAVCGHSLGAGIASLLTLLLKQANPTVRCYAFSPPGCVISEHGIAETKSCVLSLVVGDDVIPRMSYQSLYVLKSNIDHEICSTSRAKYEILIKGIFKLFCSAPWDLRDSASSNDGTTTTMAAGSASGNGADNQSTLNGGGSRDRSRLIEAAGQPRYGTPPFAQPETSTSTVVEVEGSEHVLDPDRIQLRPPGHILLLTAAKAKEKIEHFWIDYSHLTEVQLTASMFSDHLPHRVRRVVRKICEETRTDVELVGS